MMPHDRYSGARACATIHATKQAINIAGTAAKRLAETDLKASLPDDFIGTFNLGVLYLLWHQAYAIAARAIRSPYIPLKRVSPSGLATLADKDSGDGHKTRLVWIPSLLREHMGLTEAIADQVRKKPGVGPVETDDAIFFLSPDYKDITVTPSSLDEVTREFFPFPCNAPRRYMRYTLVARSFPREMIDVYMGHWRERQEPWGKWSTFDYAHYVKQLKSVVPGMLDELGFVVPRKGSKGAKGRIS